MGVATTMLGPLMPGFEARWNLDDAQGGLLFVAQFLAQVVSAAAVAPLARRIGYWRIVAAGLVIGALGVTGCASHSWTVVLLSVGLYGVGLGIAIPAANVGVAAASGGDSARRVLYLNLFWSVGAVTAPILIAQLRSAFLPSLAAAYLLMGILLAWTGAGHRPAEVVVAKTGRSLPHLLFALMLFLYVGAESSIAGWVSSYANRSASTRQLWAVLPSVFWGSILLGRLAAPSILHRVRASTLAPWSLGIAIGGALLLVAGEGPMALLAGSSIAGLGFSPVFPVTVAAYADRVGGSASGLVFSAAGLGGATIPWVVGMVSTVSGSLRMGLVTVLLLTLALFCLQIRQNRG